MFPQHTNYNNFLMNGAYIIYSICQELNKSGATLDYITAPFQSITGLDWTPLNLLFDWTCT